MAAAEEVRRRRYEIGYALAPKKQQSFIQPSLLSLASSRGIDLLAVDPSLPLTSQGPFDALLHKLSGPEWELQLRDFAAKYPATPVIDPLDAIERLHNRISMLEVVSDLRLPRAAGSSFGIPKQIVVYDAASLADASTAAALRFPVIAKPLVADGSAKSHKMALVFTPGGLLRQKPPLVLQEFVNHGGVIFKVYVVGDHVQCVRRPSLPDVTDDALDRPTEEGSLPFSQVSNINSAGPGPGPGGGKDLAEAAEMPPSSFLTEIAVGLRCAMGLHLFNFDVIRDVKIGNHYLVIDINYFPGYAKMPSYETVLTDFFWKIVHDKEGKAGLRMALDDGNEEEGKVISGNHNDGVKVGTKSCAAEEEVKEGAKNVG